METTCPACSQRLRVRDELKNPLLRCTRCGNMFRLGQGAQQAAPAETRSFSAALPSAALQPQIPTPVPDAVNKDSEDTSAEEYPTIEANRRKAVTQSGGQAQKARWGSILFVVALILLKTAPRLLNNFQRQRPVPPPPVRMRDAHARDVRQLFQHLEQQGEGNKRLPADVVPPN